MFALLARGARGFGLAARFDARFHQRIWRILIASAVMGAALWIANLLMQPLLAQHWWRGIGLLILMIIAALSYFGVGHLIGAFKLAEFKRALKRG